MIKKLSLGLFISFSILCAKPNLLFILTDQQRFDALSRRQQEMGIPEKSRIRTPNLDKISQEGAYFRSAYTPSAVCGPARTSLLTGRTIENTGVRSNWLAYEANINVPGNDAGQKIPKLKTYDEILVDSNGYLAEFYGKWHTPETKGYVYQNDVRVAGANQTWFGKYEANGTTKHMSLGLSTHYKNWLNDNNIPKNSPSQGQQINGWTDRAYIMDPLDERYGKPPGTSEGGSPQPNVHGMDLVGDNFSVTALEGQETLDAMERLHNSGKPFSLTVSFHYPHAPMVPTQKYYNMYNPDDMVVPTNINSMDNTAYRDANGRKNWSPLYTDPGAVQRWTANYYGLITEIDEWVGRILNKLDELGIAENTLVAFTSDHGEMLGGHGLREKNIFYEESAHVPLLLRFPGKIPAGVVIEEPTTNIDLYATFLDYLGVPGTHLSDGKSLRRYIEGTDTEDDFVVTEWNFTDSDHIRPAGSQPAFMIRKGNWKLIVPNLASSNLLDMAYNLTVDPYEMNNVIGQVANTASDSVLGKIEHLKALLVDYLKEMNHPATSEVENRQRWPAREFWVGDTHLDFGEVAQGTSSSDWLYMGTATNGIINISNISLEGAAAKDFDLEWAQTSIPGSGHKSLKITYNGPSMGKVTSDAFLVITGNGQSKTVSLTGKTSAVPIYVGGKKYNIPKMSYYSGFLKFNFSAIENWKAEVFSIIGTKIISINGVGSIAKNTSLESGIYMVKLKVDQVSWNYNLVVIE